MVWTGWIPWWPCGTRRRGGNAQSDWWFFEVGNVSMLGSNSGDLHRFDSVGLVQMILVSQGVQDSPGNFLNVFHDWWFKGPCCRCTRMQRGGWTLFGPLAATDYVLPFWHGYMHLSPYHTVSYSEMITELFSEMSAISRCCIKGSDMKNHSFHNIGLLNAAPTVSVLKFPGGCYTQCPGYRFNRWVNMFLLPSLDACPKDDPGAYRYLGSDLF